MRLKRPYRAKKTTGRESYTRQFVTSRVRECDACDVKVGKKEIMTEFRKYRGGFSSIKYICKECAKENLQL